MKVTTLVSLMIVAVAALPSKLVNEVKVVGFIIVDNQNDQKPKQEDKTIAQVIADDDRFSSLHEHLDDARDVKDDLDDDKLRMTLFAPINEAFDQFNQSHHKGYKMKDILQYHLTTDGVLGIGDLHDGLVLSTEFEEKNLKDERQIVRVTRREDGEVYINMMAHVVAEIATKNGKVIAIDRVLVPPPNMLESMMRVPMVFSTLATAIFRTKLERIFESHKGMTLLAPDNRAWEEKMDVQDLFYLFGEEGRKDLGKIVKHHVVKSLEYSTRFREEGHVTLKTLNRDEIVIDARQTQASHRHQRKQHQMDKICGFPFPCDVIANVDVNDDDANVDNPEGWEYLLNNDQGRIVFADAPTQNGVVHMISNVLIPEGVDLPSKRSEL
ncbi:hypothetical protein SeMB42_g03940 [Synchytrium endobioticum]|uniref:FAS1 domain-containing protein n=1 Tax=Synchytrium endobioticum TaxID=286115 RepID=A0A507D6J7_9FUNG|nr:hypothetical protein SeMB42_g03940 [Synchytrium endobioticum]TPX46878.1 hypothetical protein SeLEV6574_g02965 [Synchytrium endobioticum]